MSKIDDIRKLMPRDFTDEVNELGEEDTITMFRMKMALASLSELLVDIVEADPATTLLQATMVISAGEHLKGILGVTDDLLAELRAASPSAPTFKKATMDA